MAQSSLHRWLTRPGCPVPSHGPWSGAQVEALRSWIAATRRRLPSPAVAAGGEDGAAPAAGSVAGGAEGATLQRVELALKLERRRRLKMQNDVDEGKLLRAEAVEAQRIERIHVVKGGLLALPKRISRHKALTFLDAEHRRVLAEAVELEVRRLIDDFAGHADGGP